MSSYLSPYSSVAPLELCGLMHMCKTLRVYQFWFSGVMWPSPFWSPIFGLLCCLSNRYLVSYLSILRLLWSGSLYLLTLKTGLRLALKKRIAVLGLVCSSGLLCVSLPYHASETSYTHLNRACAAAAVRLAYVVHLFKGHTPSWDVVPIYLCSIIEISTALMASSIPALRQGFSKGRGYFDGVKKRLSETQRSDSTI